jgi:hypothetical protein
MNAEMEPAGSGAIRSRVWGARTLPSHARVLSFPRALNPAPLFRAHVLLIGAPASSTRSSLHFTGSSEDMAGVGCGVVVRGRGAWAWCVTARGAFLPRRNEV